MKFIFDKEKNVVREAVPFYVPHKWWRRTLSGLKPVERCLLISLHIWGQRRPSQRQLAKELRVHRDTIKKALAKLEKKGLL
jgi:Transcriptional regulators